MEVDVVVVVVDVVARVLVLPYWLGWTSSWW